MNHRKHEQKSMDILQIFRHVKTKLMLYAQYFLLMMQQVSMIYHT